MMRTMAPRDLGGRLCLNCARTTPELPIGGLVSDAAHVLASVRPWIPDLPSPFPPAECGVRKRTVRASDLAPDDTDLGAADLLLATVDVGNALAVVEGGGLGVVNALDLDERGVGPDRVLRALERDVLAPVGRPVSLCVLSFFHPCSCVPWCSVLSHSGGISSIRDSKFLLGWVFRCGRT